MDTTQLLLANRFLPAPAVRTAANGLEVVYLGTVLSNLAYYGFMPSAEAMAVMQGMSAADLGAYWQSIEPAVKAVTGADRDMDRFVVYKNFPSEVLEMSQARYWFSQILMYLGVPNTWFAKDEAERPAMTEKLELKVLALANETTLGSLFAALAANPARWTDPQQEQALFLFDALASEGVSVDGFGFKENGVRLAAEAFKRGVPVRVTTATDVLRLAAALSDGDVGLRQKVKFRKFKRAERRQLLGLLEACDHLIEDFFLRAEPWKRLLALLHPGEFGVPKVSAAYDRLYRGDFLSYAAQVEHGLRAKDPAVLALLATRPGDFLRRLHKAYAVFGHNAATAFLPVMDKLATAQLVKLDGYLATINGRQRLIYAPRGNWTKAQLADNKKVTIDAETLRLLRGVLSDTIKARLAARFPAGFTVAPDAALVKLQTNDQKLAAYGRGTVFPIPEAMTFVRSASYWEQKSDSSIWFDNGWNFFDANWKPKGTICWNRTDTMKGACVFSGDPVNAHELKGRACQMIDLYIDKLAAQGIRYAVWSVLCYSKTTFANATDVLATLQWGEKPEEGKLYEPSRAQMMFPLKADSLTSYVAYVDVVERTLVYMDANLYGNVGTAGLNEQTLSEKMPVVLEYLKALPTVADLFSHGAANGEGAVPVLYTDTDHFLEGGPAYVFQPRNAVNRFEAIDLAALLDDKPEALASASAA